MPAKGSVSVLFSRIDGRKACDLRLCTLCVDDLNVFDVLWFTYRKEDKVLKKGKLVVIEGLDGSGKKTQAQFLCRYIKNLASSEKMSFQGLDVEYVSFPDYNSPSSSLVKMYLNSEFGSDPSNVNPYAVSSFFAVDRYSSYTKTWANLYNSGYIVVADRYTTSNPVYQMSKLPRAQWDEYLRWLTDYEYNKLKLPVPDAVIYLDMPIKISQSLLEERYKKNPGKKDIHEINVPFLVHCNEAAKYVAQRENWSIINCAAADKLKSKEDIHKEIAEIFNKSILE
jgi:dTMP kinase